MPTLSPFANGTLVYGSDLTARATADVNQPLPEWGEGAALRLNVMVNRNNISDRDVTQYNRFGIAPSLVLGLGTPTRLTFTYLHQSEYNQPDYGLPWLYVGRPGTATAIANPAPLSQTQSNYYGFENGNYLRTNVNVPTIKFEHDFSNALTLTNQLRYASYGRAFFITEPQIYTRASALTPGSTGAFMLIPPGTPLSSLLVSRNQLAGNSTENYLVDDLDVTTRFSTGFIGHTLRAGIEVSRETSNPIRYSRIGPYSQTPLLTPNPSDTFNANTYLSTETKTTAYTQSVYALDTLQLDPQWQIMAGLRFDRFAADFEQQAFANPVTGAGSGGSVFDHIDRELSWRTALIYKPLPSGSLYFDAGNSFNPSAEALSLSLATAPLPPVENITYEIGTKWELIDGALSVNGSLFRTEQINVREPDPTNPLFNIIAGNAVAKGGELLVAGNITDRWQILAGYAYTFAEITESPTVGPTSDLGHRLGGQHPGFEITAWEVIEETLRRSGLPAPDQFEEGVWLDCWPGFERGHFLDGFGHRDKKFHFRADWAALGRNHASLPALPDHVAVIDDGDPARPFRLVPAPSRSFLNTSFNNTPSSLAREGRPTAMIHPEALAALGIADGDRVRIGNEQGSVVVHARAFAGMQKRVVIVEGLWPNNAFEEGIGINLLTSADPGLPAAARYSTTPRSGCAQGDGPALMDPR